MNGLRRADVSAGSGHLPEADRSGWPPGRHRGEGKAPPHHLDGLWGSGPGDDSDRTAGARTAHRGWGPRRDDQPDPQTASGDQPAGPFLTREDGALASVIEEDLIPRLVMAHRQAAGGAAASGLASPRTTPHRAPRRDGASRTGRTAGARTRQDGTGGGSGGHRIGESDPETLAQLIIGNDVDRAQALVDGLRMRGASLDELCAGLLGPAARLMDRYVADDICDVSDLMLGLGRLQRVLHDLDRSCGERVAPWDPDRRALVAACPGARHPFGPTMVSTVFRRAGWDVDEAFAAVSIEDLVGLVRSESYPVVALWAGGTCRLSGLADGLDAVRRASAHPAPRVCLVGRPAKDEAGAGACLGVDAVAETAPAAVEWADRLLDAAAGHN